MAFAGSELWVPEQLMERLRDYVADGGRVALFGADSFKRTIELSDDSASNASRPRPRERVRRADASCCARARRR